MISRNLMSIVETAFVLLLILPRFPPSGPDPFHSSLQVSRPSLQASNSLQASHSLQASR
ncbi:hypothetical protein KC19_12G188800 [Ceratodon purpureus]|uniref:Uncharacterized protein n=1 Tax=Ceratodon purpureus TaxID=3225 RepID=A0A8T0G9G1_CERPU|nr:hypothetical protein KC19_12G188800 [Ceratodon purpureus]